MLKTTPGTKVESAPTFDRNWYRAQTFLQFLLAATVFAGLGGVFGGGWLSSTTVRVGTLNVTYDRLARRTVPIRIVVRSTDLKDGPLRLTIGRNLIEKAAIVRTIPTAVTTTDSVAGTEFTFASPPGGPAEVVLSVQPDSFGLFRWSLKAAGIGEASLFQIIYP
jgi:hypothetical protein